MPERIPGGFILLARRLFDSEIWNEPPLYFKVWVFLLMSANHKDQVGGKLKRGQCLIRYEDIQDATTYMVGYRRERPSKPQIAKILRRLREGNMIATTKTTRGLVVTICNYETYQDPSKYESNNEDPATAMRRQQLGSTINKNDKNDKNDKKKETTPSPSSGKPKKKQPDSQAIQIYDFLKEESLKAREIDLGNDGRIKSVRKIQARLNSKCSVEECREAGKNYLWNPWWKEHTEIKFWKHVFESDSKVKQWVRKKPEPEKAIQRTIDGVRPPGQRDMGGLG